MTARLARLAAASALAALAAIALAAALCAPPAAAVQPTSDTYFYLSSIGGPGAGPGLFGGGSNPGPYDVASDAAGNLYVADPNNNTGTYAVLQKIAPDGTASTIGSYSSDPTAGEIYSPYGVAASADGTVYVLDTWRPNDDRIQIFTPAEGGYTASQIETSDIAQGHAFFIAVDAGGNVYVADNNGTDPDRVLKYGPSGGDPVVVASSLTGVNGVAVDSTGAVYVADSVWVKKFASDDGGLTYQQVGSAWDGGTEAHLSSVSGIAVDEEDCVYVVDSSVAAPKVVKFTAAGDVVKSWSLDAGGSDLALYPRGVTVNAGGAVYVCDPGMGATGNHRLLRYARDLTTPVTTAIVNPSGWTNAAEVSVTLSAGDPVVDDQYTSLVADTEYDSGAGQTTYSTPIVVTAQGVTTIHYWSTDGVGNQETPKTATVRIDRTKPAPKALKNLAVTHGHRVKLPYRVNDNVSPKAKVWIRIYRGTKRVCTKALGTHLTNRTHTCSFRCKLRKGKYTWRVYATDLAGNTQAKAGVKRLGVK